MIGFLVAAIPSLYDLDWDGYETLLNLLGDRLIRTTYRHGVVELMILSHKHERYKKLLARLVETLRTWQCHATTNGRLIAAAVY
ncbi:MAG: hypothetical protein VKJ46_05935 [Leptolyngbyaceae bacterium]|nr:hypothetical protein [Leptolyngbyaceae bacterium]